VSGGDVAAAIATHEGAADPHTGYLLLAGRAGGQHAKGGTGSADNLQLSSTNHATKGKILLGSAGTSAFDETNSRLGIGTASPSVTLDIGTGTALLANGVFAVVSDALKINPNVASTSSLDLVGGASGITNGRVRLYGGTHATLPGLTHIQGQEIIFATATANLLGLDPSDGMEFGAGLPSITLATDGTDGLIYGNTSAGGDLVLGSTKHATKDRIYFGAAKASAFDELNGRLGIKSAAPAVELEIDGQAAFRKNAYSFTNLANVDTNIHCGGVFFSQTDNGILQLPQIGSTEADQGCEITLINFATAAAARVQLSPYDGGGGAGDPIIGTCVSVTSGAVNAKDFWNTKATAKKGDYIKVIGLNDTKGWYITGCVGVWASEP
jgi:hypothetical protein